ncbi:MAG TPA: beta-ketoacyl-ACP synthase II, partial [Candidatus Limnocylindrales bacterium]
LDPKAVRRSEPALWFGVAAAKQAIADAGLEIDDANREDIGVVFGSGAGGQSLMIDNWTVLREKGPNRVAPTFIANGLVDSTSGMIAIETGAIGINLCIVTACSTGTNCVGEAAEIIRRGDATAIVTGSTEMPLLEVAHAGFGNMRGLGSPRPGEPIASVSRPFDKTRDGFILGEGAASLILEDLELAKARGARIYAEVVGYGAAADGWDMIQPVEHGAGSARAMRMALARRGVPADEVDMINPHGTSTPLGDKREAEAIWTVFGDRAAAARREIAISGTKSMTGHMMGAAGAFEAFATVLSVHHQCVPATLNYREYDPECDVFVPTESASRMVRYALSNNIGLGGHNAAVIFKRYAGD